MTGREELAAAFVDALKAVDHVSKDRAIGLAVTCDIGVSAAFLFSTDDEAHRNAAEIVRTATAHALLPEEPVTSSRTEDSSWPTP